MLSIGQNLHPFTGNGDVSIWVKNSQVGWKSWNKLIIWYFVRRFMVLERDLYIFRFGCFMQTQRGIFHLCQLEENRSLVYLQSFKMKSLHTNNHKDNESCAFHWWLRITWNVPRAGYQWNVLFGISSALLSVVYQTLTGTLLPCLFWFFLLLLFYRSHLVSLGETMRSRMNAFWKAKLSEFQFILDALRK